jgi:uncharacterized protein (TIGR04141 family)
MKYPEKKYDILYSDEDNYIQQIVDGKDRIQLHKKIIFATDKWKEKKETPVEIADVYDSNEKELIAVKLGGSYQSFAYAFDQANTAVRALINANEYALQEQLSIKKYNLSSDIIDEILETRKYAVLLGFEQDYLIKKIKNGTFSLENPKSMLFRLKVVSSVNYLLGLGITPKIYVIAGKKMAN